MSHETTALRAAHQSKQNIERLLWLAILLLTIPTCIVAGRLYERQLTAETAHRTNTR